MMKRKQLLLTASVSLLLLVHTAAAQTTAFTYQGKLTDSGNLANGQYDFQFILFDATSGGSQQGSTQTLSNVTVSNGSFSVPLDFGVCSTCFDGSARFLEIAVRPAGGGSFTTLTPRQPIASNPYAIRSLNAATATAADGLSVACVNCVTSNHIASVNGSAVTGAIPVAGVPAGNGNYIQNATNPQSSSNFNISGTGTADILNAATRFHLGGQQVLSATGSQNLFAGISAGTNNLGSNNAFFGSSAGTANTNGSENAFFGAHAGQANTTGTRNAFFGRNAGTANTTGSTNAFFGSLAGSATTIGGDNAFFGSNAGNANTSGGANTFIGKNADFDATNTTGNNNTLLGSNARVTSGISNATAIGSGAQVTLSNSLVLGNSVNVGIGTTAPQFRLDVVGDINTTTQYNLGGSRVLSALGTNNLFAGNSAGISNTGSNNAFFGAQAGNANTTGIQNAFFGFQAGINNTTGSDNTFIGIAADFSGTNTTGNFNTSLGGSSKVTANLSNATAIGYRALVNHSNSLVLGGITGVNGGTSVNVGIGTTAPENRLQVAGAIQSTGSTSAPSGNAVTLSSESTFDALQSWASRPLALNGLGNNVGIGTTAPADKLDVSGDVRVGTSGTNGCLKNNNGGTIIGTCSSDARFKRNITPFANLLSRIVQLQPVHFYWRTGQFPERHFGHAQEAGLIAQEVEKVLPELVSEDEQGYKVVNYSKLPLLTLQAIKELKQENDQLKQENATIKQENQFIRQQQQLLQTQFQALKQVVCKVSPTADLCKP